MGRPWYQWDRTVAVVHLQAMGVAAGVQRACRWELSGVRGPGRVANKVDVVALVSKNNGRQDVQSNATKEVRSATQLSVSTISAGESSVVDALASAVDKDGRSVSRMVFGGSVVNKQQIRPHAISKAEQRRMVETLTSRQGDRPSLGGRA
jgi:hypothetical protein